MVDRKISAKKSAHATEKRIKGNHNTKVVIQEDNSLIYRPKFVVVYRPKFVEEDPEAKYKEFARLIEWASTYYCGGKGKPSKIPYSYISRQDFVGEGYVVLANCMAKWDGRGNDREFAKFFKTSLFNTYKNMLIKIYSPKQRIQVEHVETADGKEKVSHSYPPNVEIDDILGMRAENDGFGDLYYDDLVKHISLKLPKMEQKIFSFMANPPEELRKEALIENRRKLKASIYGVVSGVNKVKLSGGIIIKYLKKNGEEISRGQYQDHLRNIRTVVAEVLRSGLVG